ncbi:MAG: sigma-70 family RNA polymerase sigma factor [Synechococcaceae cyanobacterium]|nr:sigma-70 family RNA polymerase sigma factor [Synechococcaceae cyanobacterium]
MAPSSTAPVHDDHNDQPRNGHLHRQDRLRRNRRALRARAGSRDAQERLCWRNAVVQDNLPLVYAMAARLRHGSDIPLEDLAQVGSIGLIRAVEAFDPSRQVRLSSFAVPYVRGAILHEIRDRGSMMRIPRGLWDLRQQVSSLQAKRRREGLPLQTTQELAKALGCDSERLREIDDLASVTAMRSLDAPQAGSEQSAGTAETLLDRLATPQRAMALEEDLQSERNPEQLDWLAMAQELLTPQRRALLLERYSLNCSWVELGQRHGVSARQAQRLVMASFASLRQLAAEGGWRVE